MPLIRRGANAPAVPGAFPGVPDEATLQALRVGTNDERWTAARALSGRPEAIDDLGAALARETDGRVREAILTGLVRVGTPASAMPILPLIRSDDASLR